MNVNTQVFIKHGSALQFVAIFNVNDRKWAYQWKEAEEPLQLIIAYVEVDAKLNCSMQKEYIIVAILK